MESKEATNQEYIIPFIHRKSLLLSISFRSLDLEMGEFIMKVESEDKKESMMTGECETTMVPKFQIDFKNKTLNYLNKTKYPKYNIYLLNKKKEEIHKFEVDLGRLSFLGKELRNVSIYYYPIIIFEFMTGYFTTEELYNKNRELSLEFTKDFEIMEKPIPLKINQSKSSNSEPVKEQKSEENKNTIEKIDLKNNASVNVINEISNPKTEKENLSKSVMPSKKKKSCH